MRDKQMETYLEGWTGFRRGLISSGKPNLQTTLSSILETENIPRRFFLSPQAALGILRRAAKKGKVLPDSIRIPLEQLVTQASLPLPKLSEVVPATQPATEN